MINQAFLKLLLIEKKTLLENSNSSELESFFVSLEKYMEKLSLLEAIRKQRNILLSQRESSQQAREIKQLYKEQLLKVTAEESLLEEYLQNNVFFYSEQNVSDSLLNP